MPPRVQLYVTVPQLAPLAYGMATVNLQGTPLEGVDVGSSVHVASVGDLSGGGGLVLCWVHGPSVLKMRFLGPTASGTAPFVFAWLG
jgi:hypothetical protein